LDYEKRKSVTVSFLSSAHPTVFACARRAGEDFHHPLLTLARERAEQFFDKVSDCEILLTFARTYFEQKS
jgi:hypothetical protein